MTLILEDPALAAIGNLQVQVAAIGVAASRRTLRTKDADSLFQARMIHPDFYPGYERRYVRMVEAA